MSKQIEDPVQTIRANALTGIGHLHIDGGRIRSDIDRDRPSFRGVLRRVVQEVREYLRQSCEIAVQADRCRTSSLFQSVFVFFDDGPRRFDRRVEHVIEQQRPPLQTHFAARETRDIQQIVDEPRHVRDLSFDDRTRSYPQRLRDTGRLQDPDGGADWREWIAQFVRENRQELVLSAVGLAQRVLRALSFCDIENDRHALTGALDAAAGEQAPEPLAIATEVFLFVRFDAAGAFILRDRRAGSRQPFGRREAIPPHPAGFQIVACEPHHVQELVVRVGDRPFHVEEGNRHDAALSDASKVLLALPEAICGATLCIYRAQLASGGTQLRATLRLLASGMVRPIH